MEDIYFYIITPSCQCQFSQSQSLQMDVINESCIFEVIEGLTPVVPSEQIADLDALSQKLLRDRKGVKRYTPGFNKKHCKVIVSKTHKICRGTTNAEQYDSSYKSIKAGNPDHLNQFLGSACLSFANHLGFVLAPQHLFILIVQAISAHVSHHIEELRHEYVAHTSGKQSLTVETDKLELNHDDWIDIIKTFNDQIAAKTVQGAYELFSTIDQFSTATDAEITASHIALMDTCQGYFSFDLYTMCGIPNFILEGSLHDWELLRSTAESIISRKTLPSLANVWLPALLPVLDKICETYRHQSIGNITSIDKPFWESFFKRGSVNGSGGYTYISGWVNCFFPVDPKGNTNTYCEPYQVGALYLSKLAGETEQDLMMKKRACKNRIARTDGTEGKGIEMFLSGCSTAPVTHTNLATQMVERLQVMSGFIGGSLTHHDNDNKFIRPEVSWWVVATARPEPLNNLAGEEEIIAERETNNKGEEMAKNAGEAAWER